MKSDAGVSISARTRWMKVAASCPSTTRWSNDDDRFIVFRGTKPPSRHKGLTTILLTPTIATSGRLTIGVDAIPPSAPSEVSVIVEPESSSRAATPWRAA